MNEALRNVLIEEIKKHNKPITLEEVQKVAATVLGSYPKEAREFNEWLMINHDHFLWQMNR